MESEKPTFTTLILGSYKKPSFSILLLFFTFLTIFSLQFSTRSLFPLSILISQQQQSSLDPITCSDFFHDVPPRKVIMSIVDFGGVGDGKTSNTQSFQRAIRYMQRFQNKGGSQLNIPAGTWLTGSFNLTSDFTLFLHHGAVLLGSQVNSQPFFYIFLISIFPFLYSIKFLFFFFQILILLFILTLNYIFW
jgi:hypothetical protein